MAAAGALLSLAPATGCGIHNLSFTSDTRLHFIEPKSRALVSLPLTISWTMKDFPAGSFAVFVDRAPVRPGQTLLAVADRQCRRTAGCFNADYLAARGVYTTGSDSLTLHQIAVRNSLESIQQHEATVVLLDASGHRIGESAWYIDFRTKRLTL